MSFSGTVTMVDTAVISGTKAGDPFSGKLVYDDSTPADSPAGNPQSYTTRRRLLPGWGLRSASVGILTRPKPAT